MRKLRTAVLISGRGSNLQALADAAQAADYPAEIATVISNRPDAPGLKLADSRGLPTRVIAHRAYATPEAFEVALDASFREFGIDIIALAGFMKVLTGSFVARWQGRILNIHPSLLPAYRGLHTHERAIADGASEHGCTVHVVTADLDSGPIIQQARVPVLPGDTADALARKVLAEEHRIYPEALAAFARRLSTEQAP